MNAKHDYQTLQTSEDLERWQDAKDYLDRSPIAKSIAAEIRQPHPPQIIGVYGWWGAGKTHVLCQAIRELQDTNEQTPTPVIFCTFRAWRYEMEGNLAPGLIRAIADSERHFPNLKIPEDRRAEYRKAAKTLLGLISELSIPASPESQIVAVGAKVVLRVVDAAIEQNSSATSLVSTVDKIEKEIEKLIDTILEAARESDARKRQFRLAVFIDDLDRCSPMNMVRMFEWLKVHLPVRNCVYIMGLDHIAAARAIVGHYREYLSKDEDLAYGLRYLEKLIDSEYVLDAAPSVETMALRHIYDSKIKGTLGQYTHNKHGGYFTGEKEMSDLLRLHSLHPPRTMLKIVRKFERVISRLEQEDARPLRDKLSDAYPFWALFLIAMYYRLDPDYMREFIKGSGIFYEVLKGNSPGNSFKEHSVVSEFYEFVLGLRTTSKGLALPDPSALQQLTAVIHAYEIT